MPLISVIVPVYNAEKTIKRCVDSIRRQTFSDVEILLIEDGAKDASGALCDSFAGEDARIRVLHKKNAGISAARNSGMDMAQGTYIQFTDSDDYLPEDYLERLMQTQKKYGEDAFVWCGIQIVGEKGITTQTIRFEEKERSVLKRQDIFKLSGAYLLNSPCNKLYHTDVIKNNRLKMEEGLSIAEDLQFNMQYMEACGDVPIIVENGVFYQYVRVGQESLDNRYRPDYYNIHKRVLGQQLQYAKKWHTEVKDYEIYYRRYWEYMQTAFANLKQAGNEMSTKDIRCEKSRILHDPSFQKSLKRQKGTMGRAGYYAMRSKWVWLVELYEKRYLSE